MNLKILGAIVLFLPIGVLGADLPPTQLPMPASLAADWWSYFQPAESITPDILVDRSNKFQEKLLTLKQQNNKASTNTNELITSLLAELKQYLTVKNTSATAEVPVVPTADHYTIDTLTQQFNAGKQKKQSLAALDDEINWQSNYLTEERHRQSRRRTSYLELPADDSKKLKSGLNLMINRFRLESESLVLDSRIQTKQTLQQYLKQLNKELDSAFDKLTTTSDEILTWQKKQASLQNQIRKLNEENSERNNKPQSIINSENATDESVILIIKKDVNRGLLEHKLLNADLILQLLNKVNDPNTKNYQQIEQVLKDNEERSQQISHQLVYWGKVTDRVRKQSAQSLATENITAAIRQQAKQKLQLTENIQRQLIELQSTIDLNQFIAGLTHKRLLAGESAWLRGIKTVINSFVTIGTESVNLLSATLFEVNETPVTTLGLLRVILILTIAWWVSNILRRTIKHFGEIRKTFSDSALYTLGRMIHYVVITIGFVIGLSSIGIDLTKFALFASALGVGVGFGLQTLVSNFVAGLIILFEKSLKVGDFVELQSGVAGEVREINMRSTLVTTNDNIDILVPNSEFVNGQVTNWTYRDANRRIRVPFGVAYGTDKDLVRKAVLEAAENVPWTLKSSNTRIPQVWFVQFGDSSLNFELVVWITKEAVKKPSAVQAAYLWEIESKLAEYHIEVPFPQRDLHVRSVFGKKDQQSLSLFEPT